MSVYGDGSNGALNVTSGSYSLALNTKYQFTDVTIASGATLTTGSTTGSVLYILATGTFTLNGTINVSGIVNRGDDTWDVTIDGTYYESPGVNNGTAYAGHSTSNGGWGSGGKATDVFMEGLYRYGGAGGSGGSSITGGTAQTTVRSSVGITSNAGIAGTNSGGGSGLAAVDIDSIIGAWDVGAVGSAGGATHGATGNNGSSYTTFTGVSGSGGTVSGTNYGGGGGGAGGYAGRAGVHVVIKARTLVLNGTIITSGTSGGNGGNGGRDSIYNYPAPNMWAMPGLGGGGGYGGNIAVTYATSFTDASTKTMSGGAGGTHGYGGSGFAYPSGGSTGGSGTSGTFSAIRLGTSVGSASGGGSITPEESEIDSIVAGGEAFGRAVYVTSYQSLVQKDYEYRVFDADGNFVGIWKDVESVFGYSQGINQSPSELNVEIARSPENRIVTFQSLKDELGSVITDEFSDPILVRTETENSVGEGTDIDLNYNVEVYAFYGGFEQLLDEFGDPILDEFSDPILTSFGNPNGLRVYSGYIADYEMVFGQTEGVKVVVVPHAAEMMQYVFKSGLATTVEYNSTDPVLMARQAMDNYISQGGVITYSTSSMPLSGTVSSYDFKLQTTREAIDKTIELLPSGYYHYVHPGENVQYLLSKGSTADHTFYYEKHISELKLRRSLTQLVNKVYLKGGDTGAGDLYTYDEDATSISSYRPGLKRLSDSRVTQVDSAEALMSRELDTYSEPRYRTSVTISDAVYEIEDINLGEMVGFKNFGSFVDDLVLQIVSIKKSAHDVTLDLDMIVPDDTKRLIELKKNLQSEEVRNIPVTPS